MFIHVVFTDDQEEPVGPFGSVTFIEIHVVCVFFMSLCICTCMRGDAYKLIINLSVGGGL